MWIKSVADTYEGRIIKIRNNTNLIFKVRNSPNLIFKVRNIPS